MEIFLLVIILGLRQKLNSTFPCKLVGRPPQPPEKYMPNTSIIIHHKYALRRNSTHIFPMFLKWGKGLYSEMYSIIWSIRITYYTTRRLDNLAVFARYIVDASDQTKGCLCVLYSFLHLKRNGNRIPPRRRATTGWRELAPKRPTRICAQSFFSFIV